MLRVVSAAMLALCVAVPVTTHAQLASCQVGQQVAFKNFRERWAPGVVVAVEPGKPYPCRVHPLGYNDLENQSWAPSMLQPISTATEPPGGLANDPYLLAAQGKTAFRPTGVLPGHYECYALSGGRLSPRLMLNFVIVDGRTYRDASGGQGTYRFDPGSLAMVFNGGALNGQRATYAQPVNPPTRNQPATVTYQESGDSCVLKL